MRPLIILCRPGSFGYTPGMPSPPDLLPDDPAVLTRMVLALAAENRRLHEQVNALKAVIFGAKSEKRAAIDPAQGTLDLGDLATEAAPVANDNGTGSAPKQPRTCRPAKRNVGALPRHLPRIETTLEPETTICLCCAGLLHKIGEDITETLDVIPAIVRVLRTIRPKYGCRSCEGAVVQAKALPRIVDGGMASTALVAWVVTAKFAWHLHLTAILIGPKFIDPRLWLGRLVGEAALVADANTRDHLALQAVVHHHNRLSTTFADHPDTYRPMASRHLDGGFDPLDWGIGFIAGIELAPRPWKKVTDTRQSGRALFEPILTLTVGSHAVPKSAVDDVVRAILAIRHLFQEQRHKSMR